MCVPLVYFLLPDKKSSTYNKALSVLKNFLTHNCPKGGFIRTLQTEQGVNESLFEQLSIGRENVIPKKRRKYKDYDERLKNVVSNYDSNDIKDYFYSVSNLLVL